MNRPLLEELQRYPQSWSLTPTNGNKQPYRRGWQTERPLERDVIAADIINGYAAGVGLRSGSVSGGILCIDFDGESALPKWLELSGGIVPPQTIGWTSGRPGRFQLAYLVPREYWDKIKTRKIPTAWDASGKPTEYLEIRWDGCQSVLPPSAHPSTAGYSWLPGLAPWECETALVPDFLIEAAFLEPKHQPSERNTSNPTNNPWDIRSFANLLDGYQPDGRRGWDTCKCPAHNGQSDDSLHIEQASGAFKCHAGCDPKQIYSDALELAKSRGYQLQELRSFHSFCGLFGWLPRLKQRFEKSRKIPWGFGRKGEVEVEPTPVKTPPAFEFQPGEQQDVYAEAHKQGYKYILDTSPTGTGKSYNAGLAKPEQFELQQLMYISNEHRNPTTPTLAEWNDLEARHDGLVRNEFGKLRRAKSGESYVVSPNCGRTDTISALRSKNVDGADTAGVVCYFCPQHEKCGAGVVFGYLNQRAVTLKSPRLRTHPASLPSPNADGDAPYDYSNVGLIWDEANEIFKAHRSIEVRVSDIKSTMDNLLFNLPDVFDILRPLLILLCSYFSGQLKAPNKYGWNNHQIREALPIPGGIDVEAIRDALKPDLAFLNTTAEHGVDLGELQPQVRKKFAASDATAAEKIGQRIGLNWLPDFLDVLLSKVVGGSLRIQQGTLTITLPDQRLREISQAAALNIYMDATGTVEDLALKLDCNPSEILHVRQATPDTSNLEIIQVATVGRLGLGQRSEFCQNRIDALITQIQQDTTGETAVIDFKRHTKKADNKRHWWVDSRGINDLERYKTIIAIGTPCPNLSELEAEFTVLFGRSPKEGTVRVKYPIQVKGTPSPDLQPYFEMDVSADPEFREFVRRRILASYHQMVGRLRAHRRSDQLLKVYIIADYPLDIPVRLVKASQLNPEAATKNERSEMAIRGAVQQLKTNGQKATQSAIAAITGVSQQHISRFRNLLISLLEDSNSKMSKTGEPPPDPREVQWMGGEHLPMLAESPPSELLFGVLAIFEAYGHKVWRQIWDAAPAAAQIKILQALALTLPAGEFRALAFSVGASLA